MPQYTKKLLGNGKGIVAWQRLARFRKTRKEIIRARGDQKANIILDIGAADGIGMSFWKGLSNKVISTNFHQSYSDQFKLAWPDEEVLTTDAKEMPFEDHSIDVVICLETLHFSPNRDTRIECLNEIKRVLATGGIFVCSVAVEVGLPAFLKYIGRKCAGLRLTTMTFGVMLRHVFYKFFDISQYDKGRQAGFDAYQFRDDVACRFDLIRCKKIPFPWPLCTNLMLVCKAQKAGAEENHSGGS